MSSVANKPILVLSLLMLALMAISMSFGASGFGWPASPQARWLVLAEIRLPRTLLAALIGAALAMSGAALQGYLRNPLAEPGLLGITGGAACGAVVAIHTGLASVVAMALPLGGLLGAGVATGVVLLLAGPRSGALGLILSGVAIASLAGALTTLALTLAPNPFAATEIMIWLLGSLSDRSLVHVWLAAPLIGLGLWLLMRTSADLDALSLGADVAENLGVDTRGLMRRIVLGATLAVGASTAVAGGISFVGLIVPHLIRPWVGYRAGRLLPASALGGACLLLASDLVVRIIQPYADIRLGVITALVGAPFFLWLIHRTARETAA